MRKTSEFSSVRLGKIYKTGYLTLTATFKEVVAKGDYG